MRIYKLKLGFGVFLMIFGLAQGFIGRSTSKHDVLGHSNEVLKLKKLDYPVGPTSNNHNLLNISPN